MYLFLLQLANGSGRSLTSLHLSRIRKGKPWFPHIHLQTTTRVTKTGCCTSTYHSVTLVMSSVLSSCSWEMLFFSSWTSPSSSFTCDSLVGGNESHLQKWHQTFPSSLCISDTNTVLEYLNEALKDLIVCNEALKEQSESFESCPLKHM